MIRAAIVGQKSFHRLSVEMMLKSAPDLKVTASMDMDDEAIQMCAGGEVDVVVILSEAVFTDVALFVKRILKARPGVKIAAILDNMDAENIVRLMRSGVSGVIPMNLENGGMAEALRRVALGDNFIPSHVADDVISRLLRKNKKKIETLTDREYQIFSTLASGKSILEISRDMGISHRTVETHKFKVMKKMGLKNMAELVHTAIREGVVRVQ